MHEKVSQPVASTSERDHLIKSDGFLIFLEVKNRSTKKKHQPVGFAVYILPMSTKNVLTIAIFREIFWDGHMKNATSQDEL